MKKISSNDIKAFIAVYSILFLCTGIFYNYLYLKHYGIEVSYFFNLNDYLSTSIVKFILGLPPLIVSILVFFFYSNSSKKRTNLPFSIVGFLILSMPIILGLIILYRHKDPGGYFIIGFTIATLILYILSRFFLNNTTISKYEQVTFYLFFTFTFISMIWASAMKDRFIVDNSDISKIKKYTFKFSEDINLNEDNLVLLCSNSSYHFIYDKKNNKTFIIPIKFVTLIETNIE